MNKFEIRKKIIKIRKQNYSENLKINSQYLFRILKKDNISGKIVGGYFPYNKEINIMNIFEDLEKKNIQFHYLR